MYDQPPSSLVLSLRTTSNPSSTSSVNASSTSTSSSSTTTRSMRAGSCSSSNADSARANYDMEDGNSTTGSSSSSSSSSGGGNASNSISIVRKRKCEALLHRSPRTPVPATLSTPHQLSTPTLRPRSATCSSDHLHHAHPLHPHQLPHPLSASRGHSHSKRSSSAQEPHQQIQQHRLRTCSSASTATFTCLDARAENRGSEPTGPNVDGSKPASSSSSFSPSSSSYALLDSKRQKRSALVGTSSTSIISSSTSASAIPLRQSTSMGTNASTSKRPRLDSFASTGHLDTSASCSGTRAQPVLEVDTSSSHQRDNTENNEDVPSGPPSASFSNLTITQPPSPAYAAFSTETPTAGPSLRLDSPTSPHLFDYAQAETRRRDEQNHHESMDCEMQVDQQRSTLSLPSIIVGQQEGQSSQSGSSDPSALSATSTARNLTTASRRRGKSPSRTRGKTPSSYTSSSSMRRRLRRATSLPLDDEIFIAKRQMDHTHRRTISCLNNASNTVNGQQMALAEIGLQNGGGGEMKEDELIIGVTPAVAAGASVDELVDENLSSTSNRPPMVAASASTSTPESSCQRPEGRPPLARSTRACNPKHSGDNDKITNQAVAPSLVTPAQLAAMHQFNMPKPPPMPVLVPPPGLGFRGASHFPPFPTRTLQAYAQAQRRLLVPTVQARVASVPDAALNGAAYRSSLVYAFPPPANASVAGLPGPSLIQAPAAQQQQQEKKKAPPTASIPGYAPPIAKDTLRELDLQEVLQCRQLRHDVVFDANLMFRPNFDGDRGDRKREAADRYWTAITRELETGCKCTAYSFAPSATARMIGRPSVPLPCICRSPVNPTIRTSVSERLPSRIVPLIQELQDILLALLPQPTADAQGPDSPIRRTGGSATAAMICETLDPALIAQEVTHRVLDVASLATFFGQILKSHCAPMRDEIVENMVKLIRTGGEENDMTMVSNGLRMCFEILELMKLDIANHQLRMLRPYLLETAADFECRTFMHLREKRPAPLAGESPESTLASSTGPPLSKTKAWVNAIQDRHQQTSVPLKMVDVRPLVIDGVLQLLFKPAIDSPDTAVQAKTSVIAHSSTATPVERQRRPKSSALPLTSEVPETLSLDTYRLQLFHGDVVDLCIVHLLLLLYRQLCSMNKRTPSAEDVEIIRRQIWVIMSEINTSAAATPASAARRTTPPMAQSIRKLESETWREGMKDVLLQISRYSSTAEGTSGYSSTTVPDAATLSMLNKWMDTNFRKDSKLFQLVQGRLRKTLSSLILHDVHQLAKTIKGKIWDMSSTELTPEANPETDAIIKQNGLTDLAGEVRLLGSRISKVVAYNAHVFKDLYATLL